MWTRALLSSLFFLVAGAAAFCQPRALPETRNAALRYWQAFAELKDPPADKAIIDEMERVLTGQAPWDEEKLGRIVAANEIALGILQRATKLPECDWGVEYSRGPQASIAFVPRAHVLARLNLLQGIRQAARGESQAAVDSWVAGIRFAQDLTKGGSLIFSLTAKSVLQLELRTLAAEAKLGHLKPSQKKQLYAGVNALPEDGFDWGLAWEMDAASTDEFFEELQRSQHPLGLFEKLMGEAAPRGCVPPSAEQRKIYNEYMADVAAALRLPPTAAKQRIADLEGKAKTICESIRQAIPSAQHVNDARLEIMAARKELLDNIASQ
ncbi:MAG TPA: hypothetical protein VEI54_10295 [Candidatus Limnocylindrales bacterium]|nr:hypothetical protein [Candidatus Limnocylindrales bacterium]